MNPGSSAPGQQAIARLAPTCELKTVTSAVTGRLGADHAGGLVGLGTCRALVLHPPSGAGAPDR